MSAVAPCASMRSPIAKIENLQVSRLLFLILKAVGVSDPFQNGEQQSTVLLYTRLPSLSKSLSITTGRGPSFSADTFSREERCFPLRTPCNCRRLCRAWLVPNWCLARTPTLEAAGLPVDEVVRRWRRHPL